MPPSSTATQKKLCRLPGCGQAHAAQRAQDEPILVQAQAISTSASTGYMRGLRLGFWDMDAVPSHGLTFPDRVADFERCARAFNSNEHNSLRTALSALQPGDSRTCHPRRAIRVLW